MDTCICMAESLCRTPETITTLLNWLQSSTKLNVFFFKRHMAVTIRNKGLYEGVSLVVQLVKNLATRQEWRRQWQPTPLLLPGKSHGRRGLVSHSLWDR